MVSTNISRTIQLCDKLSEVINNRIRSLACLVWTGVDPDSRLCQKTGAESEV